LNTRYPPGIRVFGSLRVTHLSRGRAHLEWDRWQDQPAGEAPWRHPATRGRARQESGHPTDLPHTSRPQPCCPLIIAAMVDSNTATIRLADAWHASVVLALRPTDRYSSGVLTSASSCSSAAAASSAAVLASRPAGLATEAPGLVAVAKPPAQFRLSRTSSVTDST
jgi:hypothetical protein